MVNGIERSVLITGDVANNALGFSIGVETGSYNEDRTESKISFDKIRNFAEAYPQVVVVFGHEVPDQFDIELIEQQVAFILSMIPYYVNYQFVIIVHCFIYTETNVQCK